MKIELKSDPFKVALHNLLVIAWYVIYILLVSYTIIANSRIMVEKYFLIHRYRLKVEI